MKKEDEKNENLNPEEKIEGKENQRLIQLLAELANNLANLGIVQGKDAIETAKEGADELKKNISDYIDGAEKGYSGEREEKTQIKEEFYKVIEQFSENYKRHMESYNLERQDLEEKLNDSRCSLAEIRKDKLDLEKTEEYKKYSSLVKSCEEQISRATKSGNLEEAKKRIEELEKIKSDSPIEKKKNEIQKKVKDSTKEVIQIKKAIKKIKEAEKETKIQFNFNKKSLLKEKSTELVKVKKQSKLKSLIGKITAIFKGSKKSIQPLRKQLESLTDKVKTMISTTIEKQKSVFNQVVGITTKGKDTVRDTMDKGRNIARSIAQKAARGVQGKILEINQAKKRRIAAAKSKIIDVNAQIIQKTKALENKREK